MWRVSFFRKFRGFFFRKFSFGFLFPVLPRTNSRKKSKNFRKKSQPPPSHENFPEAYPFNYIPIAAAVPAGIAAAILFGVVGYMFWQRRRRHVALKPRTLVTII
jgi:hypothetical protein